MSDLTPLFKQCVAIVQRELKLPEKESEPQPKYIVTDTFGKECGQLYLLLASISQLVAEIRPLYLRVSDEFQSNQKMTQEEKGKLDEEFRLKIQQVYEKLKVLQTYESKRSELQGKRRKGLFQGIFGDEDPQEVYFATLSSHRNQVLRFLNETASSVNKSFEKMQRKRHDRERQIDLLHFQNVDEEIDTPFDFNFVVEEVPQQQVQELAKENEELLALKKNQYKQVERLHSLMRDIMSIQLELTMHLETQAEQIGNLLSNQDSVAVDLQQGNRSLSKATARNKRGSNIIVTLCVVLGCILLVVDYIA